MDYARFRNYSDYIIFMNGKIYSLKTNRFLKLSLSNGYCVINLSKNKQTKTFRYHRILGECFIKNPHNFTTIDHIDRNSQNNKISNLRWASRKLQSINRNINKSNKTGTIGVIFEKSKNSYRAIWNNNNKQFKKSFSLKTYSDEEAKQLAINYRAKMVEKHYKDII